MEECQVVQSIAKELACLMTRDDILAWIKLCEERKVSRNFINQLISIVQKTEQSSMCGIIKSIKEALEDGIPENAIIWLYNPDVEFNKFYSKEIVSKGQKLAEEPTKTYWNLRLSIEQKKKLMEAFKSGLTILHFHQQYMKLEF